MGLRDDLKRYKEVGEQRRDDLESFIQYGEIGGQGPDTISIPVKLIELPEFVYDTQDQGGVGRAGDGEQPDVGEPVDVDHDAQAGDGDDDGDGDGDPGEGEGEHGYYEMDPEEFAEELDEELGLDLDPKGKKVVEETEGDFTDVARRGPDSTLELDTLFKRGLKRKLAMDFDEDYIREALRVDGLDARDVFDWAREQNIPVSYDWIANEAADIDETRWESLAQMEDAVDHTSVGHRIRRDGLENIPFRSEDEQYRHPEIIQEKEKNVVVVNIRDVSGSMRKKKRELVERTFTPMDWYLQGKYDNAEFRYVAHDTTAWEVERQKFFGIKSGGGTKISSAYKLAQEILENYPWSEWNRYVFAAGDAENSGSDTEESVIPLMEDIDANLHAYVEARPSRRSINAIHADTVDEHFEDNDSVVVEQIREQSDVTDAIYNILNSEDA